MTRAITYKGKLVDARRFQREISNALRACAQGAKVDFQVTTQTWKSRPKFEIAGNEFYREVATDDEIYGYVDEGTEPHEIRPKTPKGLYFAGGGFVAKTRPRVIGSGAGSRGSGIVNLRRPVQHPGTEARAFSEVIHEKWEKQAPIVLQRALDKAVE